MPNEPIKTKNSPTNPLVPGSPTDESATRLSTAARAGATRAMPPNAAISRVCARSYSIPARKKRAPVEMPWLIMMRIAPSTLCSVSAQIPSITNPRWLTDE